MSGYIVLAVYESKSSPGTLYEVRRGGDGVLYCAGCPGWLSNKNAIRRQRQDLPAQCKHTKDYVTKHPGTLYGPQWAPKVAKVAKVVTKGPAPAPAKRQPIAPQTAPLAPAPANWREMLLREKRAAESRGVATPAAALEAFAREISHFDLDEPGGAVSASAAASPELDID